jgi:hypothetical protein
MDDYLLASSGCPTELGVVYRSSRCILEMLKKTLWILLDLLLSFWVFFQIVRQSRVLLEIIGIVQQFGVFFQIAGNLFDLSLFAFPHTLA